MPDMLLIHYCYDNNNTPECQPCYYYTTATTTTTRCRVRCATNTLLLQQLQHSAMPVVLLLHYCYDNYNTLPRLPFYDCTTTTTTTTRCRASCATNTLLQRTPTTRRRFPPCYYNTTATRTTTLCHAHRATTTLLLLVQLCHARRVTITLLLRQL